jgi:hypothetical protein
MAARVRQSRGRRPDRGSAGMRTPLAPKRTARLWRAASKVPAA